MVAEPEWWEDARLATRIGAALEHFNEARHCREDRTLRACRDLLSGINVLYSAHDYQRRVLTGTSKGDDRRDAAMLTQLLLAIPGDRRFTTDGPLLQLAMLDPLLMDQAVLVRNPDNPWLSAPEIAPAFREEACSKHAAFKSQFQRYVSGGSGYRSLLRELASTTAVFRNNLQHGEKAGVRQRDIVVADVMRPVLEQTVELILNYPAGKLATYSLLADDKRFADLTNTVPARLDATVCGTIEHHGNLYRFSPGPVNADRAAVSVAWFPGTPAMYRRLDAFEGSKLYRRILVAAEAEGRTFVCNIYEG